ncbi:hypothetical protein I6F35_02995 [Bradyrhizobium sp. BRP22]|uniref:hypothetical protein n=1 Tax=Bradyrhizobium sp. BRP22 TaxID=2793821 RepID=UPI001CD2207E|nr:hypothetical protein [Bradyrhizobium sp. BRP22]MCA1452182.1 hypothetical protein [Bradyrhizobium sp. BRP22]
MANATRERRRVYAADTKTPVTQTRAEIEATLAKFGATAFAFASHQKGATVMFECAGRRVRFELPLNGDVSDAKTARHHRERWRALFLTIKSKLVSIDCQIETFEEAFLAHVVMPDGSTVGDRVRPQIADQYKGGNMPLMLAGPEK